MSVQATSWVWEHSTSRGGHRLVMLAIADAANREGRESCQSVATIAAMAGVSRATVFRATAALEEAGELHRDGTNPRYADTVIWSLPGVAGGVASCDPPGSHPVAEGVASGAPRGSHDATQPQEDLPQEALPVSVASPTDAERPDVERLCQHLADRIKANGAKPPTIGKRWRDAARLMLDADGRTEENAHAAIEWATRDEFWRANILSMPKLRERYDQLSLAAQRQRGGSSSRPAQNAAILARAADMAATGELPPWAR